ncbi:protein ORF147 [Cyprinid herpesvirus 3]|nr:protein ORF147 [Cyprinid herpesvirus 3]
MCKNFKTFPSLLSYSPALSTLFGLFNPRPSHRLSLSSPLFTPRTMAAAAAAIAVLILATATAAATRSLEDTFEGSDWSLTPAELHRPQMVALHRTGFPFTVKHGGAESTTCQCGSPERPLDGFTRSGVHLALRFFNLTHHQLFDYDHVRDQNELRCSDVRGEDSAHHDFLCLSAQRWPACECLMIARESLTRPSQYPHDVVLSHPYDDMDWRRWTLPARDIVPEAWRDIEDHFFQTDVTHTDKRGEWMLFTAHTVVDHGVEGHHIKEHVRREGLSRVRKLVAQHLVPKSSFAQYPRVETIRDEL